MCAVSMVGDDWSRRQKWPKEWPFEQNPWDQIVPYPGTSRPSSPIPEPYTPKPVKQSYPTIEEFLALKKLVEEMKAELEAAKQQDIADGNPDCEMEDKVRILKQIAKMVGIDLKGIFND